MDRFADLIRDAAARGEVGAGDPRRRARALVAYVEGVVLLAKTHNDPEVVRQLADVAFDVIGARSVAIV